MDRNGTRFVVLVLALLLHLLTLAIVPLLPGLRVLGTMVFIGLLLAAVNAVSTNRRQVAFAVALEAHAGRRAQHGFRGMLGEQRLAVAGQAQDPGDLVVLIGGGQHRERREQRFHFPKPFDLDAPPVLEEAFPAGGLG